MKTILFATILQVAAFQANQQPDTLKWYTLEEVQELMKSEPRKVFVDVVADWCKWCRVMEQETFTDKAVIAYINEHYYAVRMDYESEDPIDFLGESTNNRALATSWNVRDLPAIVFWEEDFGSRFVSTGYKKADRFLTDLKAFNEF